MLVIPPNPYMQGFVEGTQVIEKGRAITIDGGAVVPLPLDWTLPNAGSRIPLWPIGVSLGSAQGFAALGPGSEVEALIRPYNVAGQSLIPSGTGLVPADNGDISDGGSLLRGGQWTPLLIGSGAGSVSALPFQRALILTLDDVVVGAFRPPQLVRCVVLPWGDAVSGFIPG